MTSAPPAMTPTELDWEAADKAAGLHYSSTRCWCERVHGEAEAGLVLPPWAARAGGPQ